MLLRFMTTVDSNGDLEQPRTQASSDSVDSTGTSFKFYNVSISFVIQGGVTDERHRADRAVRLWWLF